MPRYSILEAPSILGLKPTGVEQLPGALLGNGLAERLGASRAGRIAPDTAYDGERDPIAKTLNVTGISRFSRRLADAIGTMIERGEFPIVLGGDCSIVLGPALALRRRGRYGLLFIDGHADFYQPEVNPNGEAASMDLAFATGRGPHAIVDLEGRAPLVRDEDACAFAFRDEEEQRQYGSQPLPRTLRAFDLERIRRDGVAESARAAVAHVARRELDGFWIHLDADCLDDAVMPAVDYRLAGGLTVRELTTVLTTAAADAQAVGLDVTIYNPHLDTDGAAGRVLTDTIVHALAGADPVAE